MNTRQARASTGNRIAFGVLIVVISLFVFLSNIGALGGVGKMISSFFIGFFGFADFAYCVMGIMIGVAIIFNVKVQLSYSKILIVLGLFMLGILALHVYSSSAHVINANYGAYLMSCYDMTNTAGGMLFGIVAFPLMKFITTVGALTVVCALFFGLAFFSFAGVFKKNVTYTATTKSSRGKKSNGTVHQIAKPQKPIEQAKAPTITDFSRSNEGQKLFIVDVDGDPLQKKHKKSKGADGYNPLYPNAMVSIEDEERIVEKSNPADKFSARGLAKDILFGSNLSDESFARFNAINNPNEALANVGAPYSAVRRNELRNKLGIDPTESVVKENFMTRYRIGATETADSDAKKRNASASSLRDKNADKSFDKSFSQNESGFKNSTNIENGLKNTANVIESTIVERVGRKDSNDMPEDFYSLKAEQTRKFNEMYSNIKPEFEASAYNRATDEDNAIKAEVVKRELVKPTKILSARETSFGDSISSTIEKAQNAVSNPNSTNMSGLQGVVARAICKDEQSPKKLKTEIVSEGYEVDTIPQQLKEDRQQEAYTVVPPSQNDRQQNDRFDMQTWKNGSQTNSNRPNVSSQPSQDKFAKIPRAFEDTLLTNDTDRNSNRNGIVEMDRNSNQNGTVEVDRNSNRNSTVEVDRNSNRNSTVENERDEKIGSMRPQEVLTKNVYSSVQNIDDRQFDNIAKTADRQFDNTAKTADRQFDNTAKIGDRQFDNTAKIGDIQFDNIAKIGDRQFNNNANRQFDNTAKTVERNVSNTGSAVDDSMKNANGVFERQTKYSAPPMSEFERNEELREQKMRSAQERGLQKVDQHSARKLERIGSEKERLTQMNIEQAISQVTPKRPYIAPPISLLTPADPSPSQNEDYEHKKRVLIETLLFFDIGAEVTDIMVGPTFSLYTLKVEMPKGRTIGSIVNLENDIAMKMEEESVRILAPIPGKNAVGIEVPNKHRRIVRLRELLTSPTFNQSKSPATFALGKNLYGSDYVCDIRNLPHMLIAGATGAGKSCCINSVIISLLYKASPEDVRLILIDPKRVELSVYAGIPHLLLDEIVCDVDKAIRALNWAITEMNRRIEYLSNLKYRDIDEYNQDSEKMGYEKMPRIVIIVDELADLMSLGKKAVEDSINRIARLARAVGIHLILATQRPSVDVVSGTIKNNLPTRVAFKVTTGPDSRTVLDANGADKLLGNGDLLYMTPKVALPERMQGAFISNSEVKAIVDFIKENNSAYFDDTIKEAIFKDKTADSQDAKDKSKKATALPPELFDALRIGLEGAPVSISNLQRKLGLGWPKAAKIYDMMDDLGYLEVDEKDPKRKKISITEQELDDLIRENLTEDNE